MTSPRFTVTMTNGTPDMPYVVMDTVNGIPAAFERTAREALDYAALRNQQEDDLRAYDALCREGILKRLIERNEAGR